MIRGTLAAALLAWSFVGPVEAQVVGGPETSAAAAEAAQDAFLLGSCIGAQLSFQGREPESCIGSVEDDCLRGAPAGASPAACARREASAWVAVASDQAFRMRGTLPDDAARAALEAAEAAMIAAREADCAALALFLARWPDMAEVEVHRCRARHDAFRAILHASRMVP